jgi:hypothetical protein
MTHTLTLGTRYDRMPIPADVERTRWFDLGRAVIGVEYRILNIVGTGEEHDRGVSLHVLDTDSGDEYLRFDVFDEEPHYHYIYPGSHNILILFDRAAFGDPLAWALECLRSRLPQMLEVCGRGDLASSIDAAAIDRVMGSVQAAAAESANLIGRSPD